MPGLAALVLVAGAVSPTRVAELTPADGAVVSSAPKVGAELELSRDQPVDLRSLRLLLDGADVTAEAKIVQTRDWPPSGLSITYAPAVLAPGPHRVEIRMTTRAGRPVVIVWSFRLQPP